MSIAVVIMMAITSLGIFGYLSKAYTDKLAPVATHIAEIQALDQQIAIEKGNIERANQTLAQLNKSVDALQNQDNKVERGVAIRKQQAKERGELNQSIKSANDNIVHLQKDKIALGSDTATSNDLGPITFIAKTLFDDSQESIDKAVRYMILCLVVVFDPLAIALLLAANFSFARRQEPEGPTPMTKEELQNYLPPNTIIEDVPETLGDIDEVHHDA